MERIAVIKEFYPESIHGLTREGAALVVPEDQKERFLAQKERFFEGFAGREKHFGIDREHAMARPFLYGEANGTWYAVSDENSGHTLTNVSRDELNLNRAAKIMRSLCAAIGALHDHGLLYLDCKPDNIYHYDLEQEDHVRLFDFDTVLPKKQLRQTQYSSYSDGWAPPEQKSWNTKEISEKTDIYAIGAVFFWLLTGRKPTGGTCGASPEETNDLEQIAENTLDLTKEGLCRGITSERILGLLRQILSHTLAARAKRYDSVSRLQADFQELSWLTDTNPMMESAVLDAEGNITAAVQESIQAGDARAEKMMEQLRRHDAAIDQMADLVSGLAESVSVLKVIPSTPSGPQSFLQHDEMQLFSGETPAPVVYSDGSTYQGQWKLGNRHGYGRYTSPDGKQTYIGDWAYDLRSGQGRLLDQSVGEYNGAWKFDKMHGYGVFKYADGRIYEGNWADGVREGEGKLYGKNINTFKGMWKNGRLSGKGMILSPSGTVIYDGSFKEGKYEGNGTFRYDSGDVYEGQWAGGRRSGTGCMTYADGGVYRGEWKDSTRHGHGRMTYASGDVYEGDWAKGLRAGKGTYIWPDGEVFEGEWQDNKRNGRGTDRYVNGDVYEGEWKDGKRHGRGRMTYADGRVYDGEWTEGNRCGKTIFTWPDGEVYEGMFDSHGRTGYGVDRYANGNIYEGQFREDKRHGRGRMTYADGRIYDGEWADGQRAGKGTFTWPDGEVFDGEWRNDRRNGRGTDRYANGDVYEGEWKDGKRHGRGRMTYAGGNVYEGEWLDGERAGKGIYRFVSGAVYEGQWEKGKYNGRGRLTYADGRIYEGEWKDNRRHGQGKMTYGAGKTYEGSWENDEKNGQGKETDGAYVRSGSFVNGKKQGVFSEYSRAYPAGVYTVRYEDDVRKG